MCSQVLGVDLPPGPVEGDFVEGHSLDLDDQGCVVAVGCERCLERLFERRNTLTLPIGLVRFPGRHPQPPWGLARFHAPGALDVIGSDVDTELSGGSEVALHLAVPAGQPNGIGERRPQVVDIGVVAVFDAHDASAACRSQAAQNAAASTCVAVHLAALLRSRLPRATSVCRAPSRCSHNARERPNHSSTSASGSGRRL